MALVIMLNIIMPFKCNKKCLERNRVISNIAPQIPVITLIWYSDSD